MDRKFVSIYVNEDQEKAAKKMKKYDMVLLPVIDPEGIPIGIVTIDDILDVLKEETTEDFQKGAAVAPFVINIRYQLYNCVTLGALLAVLFLLL